MRRSSLKPSDVLLVGTLGHGVGTNWMPVILIDVWCPFCKRQHNHGWEATRTDTVSHRVAHCDQSSPLNQGGYYIGLDPERKAEHKRFFAKHQRMYSSWEAKQLANHNPARSSPPEVDRRSHGIPGGTR